MDFITLDIDATWTCSIRLPGGRSRIHCPRSALCLAPIAPKVRVALGASRMEVLTMVWIENVWVLAFGLATGIPIVPLIGRPLNSNAVRCIPSRSSGIWTGNLGLDPGLPGAVLAPARRAISAEPIQALRNDRTNLQGRNPLRGLSLRLDRTGLTSFCVTPTIDNRYNEDRA